MTVCQLMSWSSSRCWSWRSCVKSKYLMFTLKVDGQDAISLLIQFVTGVIDGSVDWRGMFLGNSFGVSSVLLCSMLSGSGQSAHIAVFRSSSCWSCLWALAVVANESGVAGHIKFASWKFMDSLKSLAAWLLKARYSLSSFGIVSINCQAFRQRWKVSGASLG